MKTKTIPKTLSGFMELDPNDQVLFNKIKDVIESTYKCYGFYPLDTPIIEYSDVLLAKAGGETEKQIYRFLKGDNDLSLRFDMTVPLAKYVAQRYNNLVFPFKRYQIGKVFRGERPQKGRFREFYQCDIDVIGDEELSLMYDAEMPVIIYDIFKKLDFGEFVIKINNRKILKGFLEELNLVSQTEEILRIIDKIDKIGKEEVKSELLALNINEGLVNKIIDFISISGSNKEKIIALKNLNIQNDTFIKGVNELETVINNIQNYYNLSNIEINFTITRGLDYYTGTVYETFLKDYPSIGSVCSGGRYESLAEYYTEKRLPGVGISIGLTRLFYQLKEANLIKEQNNSAADYMIIPMIEDYRYIESVANELRKNNIAVDVCYLEKDFKKKLRYADRLNISYVIIIGEDEVNNNYLTLKNMQDGTQKQITINDLLKK
ncbi:MAG TPA: histidine--tRNA ligase [Bacilli bacterium]|nr:histidine--tRNA ligase [Bacilli bacterium]